MISVSSNNAAVCSRLEVNTFCSRWISPCLFLYYYGESRIPLRGLKFRHFVRNCWPWICILEKNEKKNFYLHSFHDTAQRIDARNNNDHNTNRRWSQAVVIFCLYLNEHVATMSPRATEHIKDFKSLGWHQCGFISPIASSHKYYGKKTKKIPVI